MVKPVSTPSDKESEIASMKKSQLIKISVNQADSTTELLNSSDRVKPEVALLHKHVPLMSSLRISAEVPQLISSLKCNKLKMKKV